MGDGGWGNLGGGGEGELEGDVFPVISIFYAHYTQIHMYTCTLCASMFNVHSYS